MSGLTHFDGQGNAVMVDVSEKSASHRVAIAKGKIIVNQMVYDAICAGSVKKGDVLGVARVAGIMAAKKTSDLIPMCHPLLITKCSVDFTLLPEELAVEAVATVKVNGQTGVEMEALTAVTGALLTIYDMCKALDKTMRIANVCLVQKSGGKSGDFLNHTIDSCKGSGNYA
ncbi:cyclic pyranopterin monophosphate synthase MoaC [Anaerosinus massiliensis]|uniref:cyclic pyranopterin monophosphate synthase MoaC n=1 Tax=Massilibacillus massiliensis TaxID=1806837 RepID=UPI000AFD8155|nr:cyclic pyranopterin monophosphate synthase MoaC [Massilibacillus massiliensis]